MLGGSGKERAPCCGNLRWWGRPEVQCGEGLRAAEEDTTTRAENFSFFFYAGGRQDWEPRPMGRTPMAKRFRLIIGEYGMTKK